MRINNGTSTQGIAKRKRHKYFIKTCRIQIAARNVKHKSKRRRERVGGKNPNFYYFWTHFSFCCDDVRVSSQFIIDIPHFHANFILLIWFRCPCCCLCVLSFALFIAAVSSHFVCLFSLHEYYIQSNGYLCVRWKAYYRRKQSDENGLHLNFCWCWVVRNCRKHMESSFHQRSSWFFSHIYKGIKKK